MAALPAEQLVPAMSRSCIRLADCNMYVIPGCCHARLLGILAGHMHRPHLLCCRLMQTTTSLAAVILYRCECGIQAIQGLLRSAGPGGAHEHTVLLVFGDHGQTLTGDHGGGAPEEVDSALFALHMGAYHQLRCAYASAALTAAPRCMHHSHW